MKKIISLASMAVLLAMASQAATVDWKVNDSSVNGKPYYVYNGDLSSAIAALQDGATYTKEQIAGFGNDTTWSNTGTVANRGTSSKTTNVGSTLTFIVLDSSFEDKATFHYATVSTSNYAYEPPNQGTTLTVSGWSTGTFKAVPEPTSVALLALGLVALGLKRKVA